MKPIFEFFTVFNWISPIASFLESVVNDPTPLQSNSWTFFIPYHHSLHNGWNANDIRNLMKQHGIKAWGELISGGEFFFSVKLDQAQWAEYILLQHGVPLEEKSLGAPRPKRKAKSSAPKRGKQGQDLFSTFLDDFFSFEQPPPSKRPAQKRDPLSFLDDFFDKYF